MPPGKEEMKKAFLFLLVLFFVFFNISYSTSILGVAVCSFDKYSCSKTLKSCKNGGIGLKEAKWVCNPHGGGVKNIGKSKYSWLMMGDHKYPSGLFGTKLTILSSSRKAGAGLIFRFIDDQHFYCAELSPADHQLTVYSYVGKKRMVLLSKDIKIDFNQSVKFRAVLDNSSLQLFIDDIPILEKPFCLPNEFPDAKCKNGFFVRGNAEAICNYFYDNGYSPPPFNYLLDHWNNL
jgi:hypothetical protein